VWEIRELRENGLDVWEGKELGEDFGHGLDDGERVVGRVIDQAETCASPMNRLRHAISIPATLNKCVHQPAANEKAADYATRKQPGDALRPLDGLRESGLREGKRTPARRDCARGEESAHNGS
jgi:hypothetical protein